MSQPPLSQADISQTDQVVPADVIPPGTLPPLKYRDLPVPPALKFMIGPSVILAGLSLGSGEFVLWPYITYRTQFLFFWACLVGVATQYFINMEITRWTLATGESAVTGFARLSRHWAWIFLLANAIPHVIPAWGTGAAHLLTWIMWPPELSGSGDDAVFTSAGSGYLAWIAIAGLVFCGVLLTAGPVVYKTVEKTQFALVTLVLVLVVILAMIVVRPDAIATQLKSTATFGYPQYVPELTGDITAAMLLGALAFAGCGGTLNLGQSNYIKDKGFGMGAHIGRITSPVTGQEEPVAEIGYHFPCNKENLARWRTWWRRAGMEHFLSFFLTCVFCLVVLTLISYSLFYDADGVLRKGAEQFGKGFDFILGESIMLEASVGSIGRLLFLVMGIAILFTTELAVLDVVSRISADIVKVNWLRDNPRWTESRLYFVLLWGEILVGALILAINHQDVSKNTLANFKVVASINGGIMCIYSATLLWLNCRYLPKPLRMSWPRMAVMLWAVAFFGFFAVWAGWKLLF